MFRGCLAGGLSLDFVPFQDCASSSLVAYYQRYLLVSHFEDSWR
jgi:hypothetical protein